MKYKITLLAIAAILILLMSAQVALAGAQTYVKKQRVINAGVLVPRAAIGNAEPAAPYIFYILGSRDDLKPHGWTFSNPLAGGRDSYKNTAGYWLVPLEQTTLENLAKFDVLYLSTKVAVRFLMSERDKLRRYVDGGGCLWIDNGGGMSFSTTASDAFFLPNANFTSGSGGATSQLLPRLHPLVTNPFWLSQQEVGYLGAANSVINPGYTTNISSWTVLPDPMILASIVVSTGGTGPNVGLPTIAAIEYGSGTIVMTSGFIGGKIQGPVTNWTSLPSLTTQNSNLMMAAPSALRFACNVIAYSASYSTFRKGYRRTGTSAAGLGAPLVNKWSFPGGSVTGAGSGAIESSPVIWKNIVFCTSGSTLYALDANPEADLDMNGNPDDGRQDGNVGYDIIWRNDCGGAISSPTVATMLYPDAGSITPRDFVMVTCTDGNVYIFDALPQDPATGLLSEVSIGHPGMWASATGGSGGSGSRLLPPVAQNGWIYAVGQDGYIYGHSPVLAAAPGGFTVPGTPWAIPLSIQVGTGSSNAAVKYGPVLAYTKNESNGAVVQMLSFIGHVSPSSGIANSDFIFSLPVYVASDRLMPMDPHSLDNPTNGPVAFRLSYSTSMLPVSSYPEPHVWAFDPTDPMLTGTDDISVTVDYTSAPLGTVLISSSGKTLGPNTKVYMSYAVDYTKLSSLTGYSVPYYELQPKIAGSGSVVVVEAGATPAFGPNDRFYLGVSWPDRSTIASPGTGLSSVYCLWFDGNRATPRLEWNYFLHGGGSFPDPNSSPGALGNLVTIEQATDPLDPAHPSHWWGVCAKVQSDPNATPVHVKNLDVKTTPAVTRDRIFVTATTDNPGLSGLSQGYLLCFKANPEFVIRLNRSLRDPTDNHTFNVRIWQPDMLFNSTAITDPPVIAAANIPSSMIDYDTGTITISDFSKIRLRGATTGVITAPITSSLPVWVYVDNQPVPFSQVDLTSWDNLLWALALPDHEGHGPCRGVHSSPVVIGDYVYFTCDDGYMYGVSVDASPDLGTKILDPKDDDVMPMQEPISGSIIANNTGRVSLAGSNNLLAVPSSTGLYVFKNDTYLVTDNHRVLEIGSDGNVSWSCDSAIEGQDLTGGSAPSSTAANVAVKSRDLSKPLVAQKFSAADYLVVDSGNDRVIRMDRGGMVEWSISQFDDSYKNLLRSGAPTKLKSPSDALMWSEFEKVGDDWFFLNHCLIADTGNFRIVDIVDRFAANDKWQILGPIKVGTDGKIIHELNWVSDTTYKDKQFSFNSIQIVHGKGIPGDPDALVDQVWASASNYGLGTASDPTLTKSTGGGQLGGAILSMTYRQSAAPYEWDYSGTGIVTGQLTTLDDGGISVVLSGPTYFSVLNSDPMELLICDSSAVYWTQGTTVYRKITESMYQWLTRDVTNAENNNTIMDNVTAPIPFSPRRAQMLPNGRLLIANAYAGSMYNQERSKFTGEVFEVGDIQNGGNDTFNHIFWYAPHMTLYPTKGRWVQKMPNAPNLDQPTCVQKLF